MSADDKDKRTSGQIAVNESHETAADRHDRADDKRDDSRPIHQDDSIQSVSAQDTPTQSSPEPDASIEELTIEPRKPRKLPRWTFHSIIAVLVVALVAAGVGVWGYSHWRHIAVSVNGTEQQVRADTTLGKLAKDNRDFGAKPGRLISVSGKVLKSTGGEPVVYRVNGKKIASVDATKHKTSKENSKEATGVPANLNSVKLPENARISVKSGKDVVEKHDIQRTVVPFNVIINGHGVIQKLRQAGKDGSSEVWTGKISGERVNKGVVTQPQDVIVDTFSPKPASCKVVALTFDDGPSQYSGPILDILKEKGAKATFFDIGTGSAEYPQMEQRMVAEGHQVASHSNTHPDMKKLNAEQLRTDISQGLANIKTASGVTTKMLRAPYGNFGVDQWRYTSDLIDSNVIWTVDTQDWKKLGAPEISDAALSKAYNGAVILMHDGGGDRSQDIAALPGIIDGLRGQGYEFVTIDQLIAMNGK
ncbi:polysaccharide deacetylase family protein [Bifidobacterium sp. ESL0682]|uniref:polysaccharide deacetylase family protein n=1 Tax=Bifidobacterium sp. ESL0682 TaxID=2983212 RepID=UPI0023F6B2A9|nr:polysaccharide deacetylase family protein [Bifidobacterium sp. ESL0682]WEV42249.1 polysaccharide deacetylase family protein [Bifidobacterium sp. ESL0682]